MSSGYINLPPESGGAGQNFIWLPLNEGAGVPLMLDTIPQTSKGAYALFPVGGAYSGPAVRVKRASDSTTQDFTAAEVQNGTLEAFLAATTGIALTEYDVSNNGYHKVAASDAAAPAIKKDSNGYWFLDYQGNKKLTCASFFGANTNTTFVTLWQFVSNLTPAGGVPTMTSFQAGHNFDTGFGSMFPGWWTTLMSPNYKGNLAYDTEFDWNDAKPRVHLAKWLNGTYTPYEYAAPSRVSFSVANPTFVLNETGFNAAQQANLRSYGSFFFDGDADAQEIFNVIKATFPLWFSSDDFILYMGDSNTTTGFSGTGLAWPRKVYVGETFTTPMHGRAIGGTTIQHQLSSPDRLTWYFENFNYTSSTIILFLGTNDIVVDAQTGAQTYAKLEALADTLRAAGATRIIAVTMLPRTATGFAVERDAFNALLIANANGKFDGIVNTTTNANLQDQNNATYFADPVHLNATGQTQLANMILAVL